MEVARRARAFGMEIVAHDPFVSTAVAKEQGIRLAKLEEVYAAADYLTLHVGLTPNRGHDQRGFGEENEARRAAGNRPRGTGG
jgi:phosphoglycerate dehydrogenase-like enzyme